MSDIAAPPNPTAQPSDDDDAVVVAGGPVLDPVLIPRPRLRRYYALHMLGALFPVTAATALYGWRAPGSIGLAMLAGAAAAWFWKRIGRRGASVRISHAMWLSLLLALLLPPHLLSTADAFTGKSTHPWAILVGGPVLLVALLWALGGVGLTRAHPLLLCYLTLAIAFGSSLTPRLVLHRAKTGAGDLSAHAPAAGPTMRADEPWLAQRELPAPSDALRIDRTAAQRLGEYTRGQSTHRGDFHTLDGLLRDAMPPLEDLVVGGHPGPTGASSAIAILIGGLFLIHRRLIFFRVPLLVILVAYVAFLLLPVPVVITPDGAQFRPLARSHQDWGTILTFVNYEVMASPLLIVAFFLAAGPSVAPSAPRARTRYALLLGLTAAGAQLYLSCALGPYVALCLVGLLSPWLDDRYAASAQS